MQLPLSVVLAASAAVSLAASAPFLLTVRREPAVRSALEKLPRERISGTVLTAIALFWCIPNIRPIFQPDSPFQAFILPLILLAMVLAAIFLNYLFARAAAGILILGAHAVLKEAYPAQLPGYPVLAALALTAGVIGIVISAKPYWLRDWFRLSFRNPAVRWTSAAYFLLLCAMSCFCAAEAA
jgi:hypothetical protein